MCQTKEFAYQDITEKINIYLKAEIKSRTIRNDEFVFKAMILPESRIFNIINGKDKIQDYFYLQGIYDTTPKAGYIYVRK